ncbi:MAG: hypothetical protein COT85_05750 [Chlamydiae bacterium CG10_big_fil_rev_8_21_14_0_10_42_34]|nr:MAG: hypothetical protein COT85_05750 [Chlamydiae bacterium CG10_big_fil_rev_8_21_14_0_10_42_34]
MSAQFLFLIFAGFFGLFSVANANMTWSTPVTVYSQMAQSPQQAKIALHPTSSAAAIVWKTEDNGAYIIQASYFNGTTWAAPTNLGTSSVLPRIEVGISSTGAAVALWDQFIGGTLSLNAATYSNSSWSSATELANLGTSYFASFPTLSVNGSGNAAANWQDAASEIKAITYLASSNSWSSTYGLSEAGLTVSTEVPSPLQLKDDNTITTILFTPTAIWSDTTQALSPNGVPDNTRLLPYCTVAAEPIFKMDQNNGHAAFIFQCPNNKFIIFGTNYFESNVQDSWHFTIPSVPNPRVNVASFDLTVNPNSSSANAVWELGNGYVQVNNFNGVEWKIAATLSTNGSSPVVATNPTNNHVVAVWVDLINGGSDNTIKLSEFNGTTWSNPTSISSTSSTLGSPRIEINSQGFGIITWHRLVGSDDIIEAVTSTM